MSNVAVLFQFRRAFPQERVGSDCAILNRQFQKTAFSVSIPTGHCRGLRVLLPTKDGFPISIPSWQFPKTAFPVSIPSRQFQKTAFPVSIPSRQFQKTAFPVSIPSRQFQKGAMRGQKKGVSARALGHLSPKKGLKAAVFLSSFVTRAHEKKRYSTAAFPGKGSDCAIPSRQFQKNGFFSFNSH